jgi:hypothetical protein
MSAVDACGLLVAALLVAYLAFALVRGETL